MRTRRLTLNERINFMSFQLSWYNNPAMLGWFKRLQKEKFESSEIRIGLQPHIDSSIGKKHCKYPYVGLTKIKIF